MFKSQLETLFCCHCIKKKLASQKHWTVKRKYICHNKFLTFYLTFLNACKKYRVKIWWSLHETIILWYMIQEKCRLHLGSSLKLNFDLDRRWLV